MFASQTSTARTYATVGVETGIESASPHKLILMLYEGALVSISSARLHMQRKEVAEKGAAISKAIEIISTGLKAGLDTNAGGDLALRLSALYDYMCTRLLHANMKNDPRALDEVAKLLGELKSAWEEIADDPAVLSRNKAGA